MSAKSSIEVSIDIASSIDNVFARLTDHGAYGRFPNVMAARLCQPGTEERNGKGAVREVTLRVFGFLPVEFTEDIVAYQKPNFYEYRVRSARYHLGVFTLDVGVIHHLGRVSLSEENGTTRVHWVSTFEMTWPVVKYVTGPALKVQATRIFTTVLECIKKEAEA